MTPEQLKRIYEENIRRRQRLVVRSLMSAAAVSNSPGGGSPSDSSSGLSYADYNVALDFDGNEYWYDGDQKASLTAVPGYTFTRTGAKEELTGLPSVADYAENIPSVSEGLGYHARTAVTNQSFNSHTLNLWNKGSHVASVTANAAVAPDGTTTAEMLTEGTLTGSRSIFGNTAVLAASAVNTFSFYAKAGTLGLVQLGLTGSYNFNVPMWANFDLVNGVVGNKSAAGNAYIYDAGNGWWRCVLTGTGDSAPNSPFNITMINSLSDGAGPSYLGTGRTLYVWGVSAIQGDYPDGGPLITTTTAAVTIGADSLSTGCLVPPATDAFLFLSYDSLKATGFTPFRLNTLGLAAGVKNTITFYPSGGLMYFESIVGGVYQGEVTLAFTPGLQAFGLRIRSGQIKAYRFAGGNHSATSEVTVTLPAANLDGLHLHNSTGASQLNGIYKGAFVNLGTFSDGQCQAMLENALA